MPEIEMSDGPLEVSAGCLVLFALLATVTLAVLAFPFLGTETQRGIVFRCFGYPAVPQGSYSPMRVLSFSREHDAYVVTVKRTAAASSDPDPIDYDAIARKHGLVPVEPPKSEVGGSAVDYEALAKRHGGVLVGKPRSADHLGNPQFRPPEIVYTAECTPHFWNLCAPLTPGRDYYVRWISPERNEIAIAEATTNAEGNLAVVREKTRIFSVRGWKATE